VALSKLNRGGSVKLLVQPGDGVTPLVKGIGKARKSVEIAIFRLDRTEIERALEDAVDRGVSVHALIGAAEAGGETTRRLEERLLERGVMVARTSDDLVRYHGKMMIVDRAELYVLAFNFTYLDIEHSRSFGIVTRNRQLVQEAVRLFDSDIRRQPYLPGWDRFLVSPLNARKQLAAFIKGARRELLVYDQRVSDRAMIRLLEERAKAGVDIRIIGRISRKRSVLAVRALPRLRLHTRTMVRDRHQVFLGSQSLRELELDARREIGVIFRDPRIVNSLVKIFGEDWGSAEVLEARPARKDTGAPATKAAKEVAKAVARDLPPVAPVVEEVVRQVVGRAADVDLDRREVEDTVKDAVKEAVREAVKGMVEQVVEEKEPGQAK
jgi:phosphatidylserine/phosphatidylglycerophosphate/cardiolipin synthase-like enzyme